MLAQCINVHLICLCTVYNDSYYDSLFFNLYKLLYWTTASILPSQQVFAFIFLTFPPRVLAVLVCSMGFTTRTLIFFKTALLWNFGTILLQVLSIPVIIRKYAESHTQLDYLLISSNFFDYESMELSKFFLVDFLLLREHSSQTIELKMKNYHLQLFCNNF